VPPDHEKEAGGESSKGLFLERMIQVANTGIIMETKKQLTTSEKNQSSPAIWCTSLF
jgi:hypothetical protein